MTRTLGIDWGEKRLGLAVTDPLNITAQPLAFLPSSNEKGLWEALTGIVRQYEIERIVVGIPVRTDGTEGEKAVRVRAWIARAKENLKGVSFFEVDERFTTAHARRLLQEGGVKARDEKGKIDKISAALILEQFLARK